MTGGAANRGRWPARDLPQGPWAALLLLVATTIPAPAHAQVEARFATGLLWRVSGVGAAPSYIFGTIHVADPRVLELPDPVGRALADSRRFYAESVQGEREAARFFEAAQFEDGRRLEPLIGPSAFLEASALLRERAVPDRVVARLKPWAVLANLTAAPAGYGATTLDQRLVELARVRKLRVMGLEGIEEQIAVFDSIPMRTQIALVRHALEHRDELAATIEPLVQAWLKRDLSAIHAASFSIGKRYPEVAPHYEVLRGHVVDNRSVVMAHRLHAPLREGRAFAAVGAAHLYGERGMLGLLESEGYRIERVY